MASLNVCLHCGSEAEFLLEDSGMYVKCKNVNCGIRTPSFQASFEHSARNRVAGVWNKSHGDSAGDEWPEWVQPDPSKNIS